VIPRIHKYPRTRHIEGSRLGPGDEDLESVRFAEIEGRPLVVEEKVDGANAAVSFSSSGDLLLQSRGHYLVGGERERHFDLLKRWARTHQAALHGVLGARYVLYGEWLYAKHTVYYDELPHYFLEFDVLDTDAGAFLSTDRRRDLLAGAPVASVPVLWRGPATSLGALRGLVGASLYKSPAWRERLEASAVERDLDLERVRRETDPETLGEGLYIKVEEGGRVVERYKFVRASFLAAVFASEGHWLNRPILPNRLRDGVDLFGSAM